MQDLPDLNSPFGDRYYIEEIVSVNEQIENVRNNKTETKELNF